MKKKKVIKLKREITFFPDGGNGPESCTLILDETAAHRARNDVLLVASLERDKSNGCDDLVCVEFRCGFEVKYRGADDTFRPSMERLNVFSDSFNFGVHDKHSMDEYEAESVTLEELEEAMREAGWLSEKEPNEKENS